MYINNCSNMYYCRKKYQGPLVGAMKNCGRDPKQLCALIETICDHYQVYILNIPFKPRVISVIQIK